MKTISIYKYFELLALFLGVPLLYHFDVIPGHKSLPLLVVFTILLVYLLLSNTFNKKELGLNGFKGWFFLLIRSAVVAIIITGATYLFLPEYLFYLPKQNPLLWLMIMIFYPIWSAFTQELIYRPFFFYRYGNLFQNRTVGSIVNGLLFGFLHVIFGNWIAVVGATIMGTIWAFSYTKHRSLMAVAIEHAIVGNLLFTIGLGQFFYVPDF